jgi:hypothetical protein
VRKIAKKVWKANKAMTIADMVNSDEVKQATDDINYSKGTLRNWVKDLAPSNKSGRRPKKN